MAVRLPSISVPSPVPVDGFAICDSRGRRVSLLNDDETPFNLHHFGQYSSPRHFPSSPSQSSDSDLSYHPASYPSGSPATTSPSIPAVSPRLPALNDLISFTLPNYDLTGSPSRKSSASSGSDYSHRGNIVTVASRRGSMQSTSSKGTKRRYECATCGKTFTTSGHVARHNRIHTGEKNFQCPEPGCSQRFSRQDNCMQHYRTHKSHAHAPQHNSSSPRSVAAASVSQQKHIKRRRPGEKETAGISFDPNDRLNAFATYVSVFA